MSSASATIVQPPWIPACYSPITEPAVGYGGALVGAFFIPKKSKWESKFQMPDIEALGGGFRYLIARALGLKMGIDAARGSEDWAFYIVFGSAWLR